MVGVVTGCGTASPSPRFDRDTPSSSGVSPSNRAAGGSPVIRSTLIHHNYVRLPVSSADLDRLVRIHGDVIEALTARGSFEGQTYPARSTDDGGSWLIDGPQFNGGGASGGSQIDHLTATSDRTLVAWGRFGRSVMTRAAGDTYWRSASLGTVLTARVDGSSLVATTRGGNYTSYDDGLSWRSR
jgi:hypothetical protein